MRTLEDDSLPYAQANAWYPTCYKEIYIYFAIRIYMTLYVCNKLSNYWDTKEFTPMHPILKEMQRDRFQELHMRVQLAGKDAIRPFAKVSLFIPYF